jgi:hypothetical protein
MNGVLADIHARLVAATAAVAEYEAAVEALSAQALDDIQTGIAPQVQTVRDELAAIQEQIALAQDQLAALQAGGVEAANVTVAENEWFDPDTNAQEAFEQLAAELQQASDAVVTLGDAVAARQLKSEKNEPNGYVGLDGNGKVAIASLPFGTDANNLVSLDGNGKLPAVDGSQLTGIPRFGAGQSWQSVTRASGTSYQNTTGRTIVLTVLFGSTGANAPNTIEVSVNNSSWITIASSSVYDDAYAVSGNISAVIPAGLYYRANYVSNLQAALELR